MANPLRPEMVTGPGRSFAQSAPSTSLPFNPAAILSGQIPVPNTGPGSLTPEDWAVVAQILKQTGAGIGSLAGDIGHTLGREITEANRPWIRSAESGAQDLRDYLITGLTPHIPPVVGAVTGPVPPTPGPTATGAGGVPTPGSVAATGGRGGYNPARAAMKTAEGLTPPNFQAPDFSKTEALIDALTAGTAPETPTGRDYAYAAITGAAQGLASGRNLEHGIMLGVAGALAGKAAEEDEYLARRERYEAREADINLKKAEIGANLEQTRRNFELQQQSAIQNYQQVKAQLELQAIQIQANQAIEWAKLTQPYLGIANNRLIMVPKNPDGSYGEPKSWTINEFDDAMSQAIRASKLAGTLGGGANTVTVGTQNLKANIKDPFIANLLSAGIIKARQDWHTEEVQTIAGQVREQILQENPGLQMVNADELENLVFERTAVRLGMGMGAAAASGRDVPPLNYTPAEPGFGSGFMRGLGGPVVGPLIDFATE